nr:DUF2955 domain-containing protein [Aestuariicella hydrocarbonica]
MRISGGSTLGFLISKLMGWDNGVFFTVMPALLLGLVPTLNRHIILQFLASIPVVSVTVAFGYGHFGNNPVVMTLLVAGLFVLLFREMSKGPLFLFGAITMVNTSISLHFASYSSISLDDLLMTNLASTVLAIMIGFLMHTLFADIEPRQPRPTTSKLRSTVRHETILAATVATTSFVVFQCFDLLDSLSAQLASILILFPMNWRGSAPAGWNRAVGTLVGCNLGLLMQLLLMNWSSLLLFSAFALWLSLLLMSRYHMLEGGVAAGGFSAITTVVVLFSQYLAPDQDIVYSAMYRFTSLSVSVLITLSLVYLMHQLLNQFQSTQLQTTA